MFVAILCGNERLFIMLCTRGVYKLLILTDANPGCMTSEFLMFYASFLLLFSFRLGHF